MKKWLLVLLTLVLSLTLALGISACKKDEEHTHDWSQEWSADETNHWHNCNGCDQHTGTAPHEYDDDSDATCNICGHTRHIHTYKWEHDNEYHWQVKDCHPDDEIKDKALHDFSNGPVCPVCNFDSTGVHLHEYEWQYDGENHWEQSTCADHDPVTRNSEAHSFDPVTGLCKCGVSKSEVDVYSLYKANETLKGSTVKSLMDWKNDLKEEGIDHVALTSVGDGALYTLVEDTTDQFTEEVRYFAPRTLNLNAAYKNGSLTTNVEEVCFVVKCKVNGDYQTLGASQVLAVAKTDSSGNAALTFTPVFGYSSSTVEYIVSLAASGELPAGTLRPIPNGYKILDGDATKTLAVSAASATLSENFTVYRTLGAGDRGELDNIRFDSYQEDESETNDFFLDNLAAGIYKVELKASTKGYMSSGSTTVSVDGTGGSKDISITTINLGNPDTAGGEGWLYVNIAEDSQILSVHRVIGAFIGDIKLIPFTAPKINAVETNYDLAGIGDIQYDISELPDGMYSYTFSTGSPSVKINDRQLYKNKVFEKGSSDTTLTLNSGASGNAVHNFRLSKVETVNADEEKTVPFTPLVKSFKYAFTPTQKGSYSIELTALGDQTPTFKNLSVTYIDSSTIYLMSGGEGSSDKLYFNVNESKLNNAILFTFSTTNDDCAPVRIKFHFEKAQEVNIDEAFNIAFTSDSLQKEVTLTIPKGTYFVKLTGDNLEKVSVEKGNSSLIYKGDAGATILTAAFSVTAASEDVTLKFKYDGTDNYPTVNAIIETVDLESATSISANTDFTVTFPDDNQYVVYKFSPEETDYFALVLNSASDYSAMKVYAFKKGNQASIFVGTSSSERTGETVTNHGSINNPLYSSETLYLLFLIDMTEDYPTVTANFHYRFEISGTSYAPSSSGYTVTFDSVEGATNYELYMSSNRNTGFEKVQDYDSDDELVYTYTELSGGYKYFYFIAKDSTGKYLEGKSATNAQTSIYFTPRKQITFTLTVPEGFDNDVTFTFKSTMPGSSQVLDTVTQHVKAEPGQPTVTVPVVIQTTESCKVSLTFGGANANLYKTPASITVSSGSTTGEITIEKYPVITVTVDLSSVANFVGGNVKVVLYGSGTITSYGEATAQVEHGAKSATILVPITKDVSSVTLVAKITTYPTGCFVIGEQGDVTYDEATKTGTATVQLGQYPEVTVNMTFPENVTGTFTVKFKQGGSVKANVTIDSSSATSAIVHLAEGEYEIEVTVPSNSGYTIDESTVLTLTVDSDAETVDITVKDHIAITVNVEANKNPSSTTVKVDIFEKGQESGSPITTITMPAFTEEGGRYKSTTTIFVEQGKQYVAKRNSGTSTNVTFNEDSIDITVEGNAGTVNFTANVQIIYTINFTVNKGSYSKSANNNVVLYKNGEEFKSVSMNLNSTSNLCTLTMSEEEYDPTAQYAVRFVLAVTSSQTFYCPGQIVNFGSGTVVNVSSTLTNTKYTKTVYAKFGTVPADFEDSTNEYNVTAYEIGGEKICDIGKITFKPGNVANTISTTYLASSKTMYWEIAPASGGGIISTRSESHEWYASVGDVTGTVSVSVTATLARAAKATVTVTASADFASKAVTVIVLDSSNKMLLKQDITVSSTSQSLELYLPELSGCKLLYLAPDGYTAAGPGTYTAESEAHTAGSIAIQVTQNT